MLIFTEGGKPENPEKNPRSKGENQQQTQLTYDTKSGNRTRVAVVRGKRSHRYATHASHITTCSSHSHFSYFPFGQIPIPFKFRPRTSNKRQSSWLNLYFSQCTTVGKYANDQFENKRHPILSCKQGLNYTPRDKYFMQTHI
jgi:hypothetical protein